ncbi:MAG: hypothetical protein J0H87_02790 [Holosporales bacterium]|nr:hypothetical protein [Holosporales bacterium]
MKKTITLWSLYIFSLVVANILQAGHGSPWDPRDEKTDQVVGEENQTQPVELE